MTIAGGTIYKTESKMQTSTAKEAGWRLSRYNISTDAPEGEGRIIANLYTGSIAVYSVLECYLLSVFERLDEDHPMIKLFAERGLIVNCDELAAIDAAGRMSSGAAGPVSLTICPTMGCNFDCPYCFEQHGQGLMSIEVQDDVVKLAGRLLEVSRARKLNVSWFGGEPLTAPDVIGSLSARLIALAEEHGAEYSASITTNGYLMTEENIAMLEKAKVSSAQVTLDGIGEAHDRTRHLAGGGGTFKVITDNLRSRRIPFNVTIRHNVSADNASEAEKLRAFVKELAKESGNHIGFAPALLRDSAAAAGRKTELHLLEGDEAAEVDAAWVCHASSVSRPLFCGAQRLWSVCIDDKGRLYKCWETLDDPAMSFGSAADWDPEKPLLSADAPDMLSGFINSASPLDDEECRECIWLPHCQGGCPYQRLYMGRRCPGYRNRPDIFLRTMYEKLVSRDGKKDEEKD